MKKIYIILSHSGTIPSKLVKLFTLYKYSHVSISLNDSLETMYSFGRKSINNPFNGGFIIEKRLGKFFKKYNKTRCTVLELNVSREQYLKIIDIINKYKKDIDIYKYNFIGVFFKIFNIRITRKNYNDCSSFVASVLKEASIYNFNKRVVKPVDFLSIPDNKIIYSGRILDY